MSEFEAACYTISIRKEDTEDGVQFVARVAELPDVEILAESFDEAYADALDVIETSKEMFADEGLSFPEPELNFDREYSGRLPLRVPKTLHRALVAQAEKEGLSLNAYANYLLSQRSLLTEVVNRVDSVINTKKATIVDFEESVVGTTGNVVPMVVGMGGSDVQH